MRLAAVETLDEIVAEQPIATHPLAGDYRQLQPGARLSATPMRPTRPAPLPGQHNQEVLLEIGYTREQIDEFTSRGVLRSA